MRCLVAPECQTSSGAFHYDRRVEAAQHAGLVVLGWIEISRCGIVRIRQVSLARRTQPLTTGRVYETESIRTVDAKDMAGKDVNAVDQINRM